MSTWENQFFYIQREKTQNGLRGLLRHFLRYKVQCVMQ